MRPPLRLETCKISVALVLQFDGAAFAQGVKLFIG